MQLAVHAHALFVVAIYPHILTYTHTLWQIQTVYTQYAKTGEIKRHGASQHLCLQNPGFQEMIGKHRARPP